MAITNEEIFGPVASLIRFETEAEAIRIANGTPYGLAAYLFSQNISRAWRVAEALESGMVGVNEGVFSNEVDAIRRHQAVGLGPRGRAGRSRRISRDEIPLPWRHHRASGQVIGRGIGYRSSLANQIERRL